MNNDLFFKDAFTQTSEGIDLEINKLTTGCISSKEDNFNLDAEGNLTVKTITTTEQELGGSADYIVERGSDTNGSWEKWNSGIMKTIQKVNLRTGTPSATTPLQFWLSPTYNFIQPFIAEPDSVNYEIFYTEAQVTWIVPHRDLRPTATQTHRILFLANTVVGLQNRPVTLQITAQGRWK